MNIVQESASSRDEALKLYTNALNSNVISRYDPAFKQLLCYTSHCVIYKFNDESDEWVKTDFQGALALYARDQLSKSSLQRIESLQDLQTILCFGLILLNRNNPDCFSLGLVPNEISRLCSYSDDFAVHEMDVELNDNLIIVRNLLGDIYGLWVFNEADRLVLLETIKLCLNSSSPDSQ
ncbi:DCP1 [Candida oxycetoniae]|uniref:DCP1 n=1 Tax=Candida oxycetoniae TaxID=497107 RepID=A0AAI9T0M6_9ASCO|nr:DCP1 [Candida oxycetoniae]KAI3406424.2 DCP1 [Candida oxycetoniae]